MADSYAWRGTGTDLGLASDWINSTRGENPASTVPGIADDATLGTPGGGTATGAVSVRSIRIGSSATDAWTLSGQITAGTSAIYGTTTITSAGRLVVTGVAGGGLPNGGSVFASVTVDGGRFDGAASTTSIFSSSNTVPVTFTVRGGGAATVLAASVTGTATINGNPSVGLVVTGTGSRFTTVLDPNAPGSGALSIASGSAGNGSLAVDAGGLVSVAGVLQVGQNSGAGIATVGAGGRLVVGGPMFLGGGSGPPSTSGGGTLVVQGGGTVQSTAAADVTMPYLSVGNSGASAGSVTVTGAGSLLDLGANAAGIGTGGVGRLTVSAGGRFRSGSADSSVLGALYAGASGPSSGSVMVTGAGSSIDAAGVAWFGQAGTGVLAVEQGGAFTADGVVIGAGMADSVAFGSGSAQVRTGGTLHSRGNLAVGSDGVAGALLVDAATAYADRTIMVGSGADRAGSGTATVQNGGVLRSGGQHVTGVAIGSGSGSDGSVTVTGSGSLLDASGDRIAVANGTLTVALGGKVLAGPGSSAADSALVVGTPGGTGRVMVGGAGSQLLAAGLAVLDGTAALGVATGGLFRASGLAMAAGSTLSLDSASRAVVGTSAGSNGTLTVDAGFGLYGAGAITAAALVNNGTVTARNGTLSLSGTLGGTGVYGADSATLLLPGFAAGARFQFTGTSTIRLQGAAAGDATVSGFDAGDVFDFGTAQSVAVAGNAVTVRSGAASSTVTFSGLAAGSTLATAGDGAGGINVLVQLDPLFDRAFYLAQYPDIGAAGADPYTHFFAMGYKEGRSPSPFFDTRYYLAHNPDVAAAGVNPLLHYETVGYKEGRNPSAAFDTKDYLAANLDVKAAGIDPLVHYVYSGRFEGRAAFAVSGVAPDPLVDAAYYYARYPDVRAAGVDATAHYLSNGGFEGRNPDAFFDSNFYLTQNPDVRAAGFNPLRHFENNGWYEGRQPSLLFDDAKYNAAYPDVAAARFDPLVHYLQNGQFEGRQAFLTGGTAPADALVNTAFYDAQLGATLIPTGTAGAQQAAWSYDHGGWQKGLDPDAFFDTSYYLDHNPDVAAAQFNPLAHYEAFGWHENRDPSAQFSTSKYLAAYSDVRNAGVDPLLHYVVNGQFEGRQAFPV